MQRVLAIAVLAVLLAVQVSADIYLQTRGSNNRLDDENRDRDNANRLFDSQNNNRGGYNVGNHYYYAGSVVPLEWTNQHSCGNPNAGCEIVIQYMCDDRLRDGTTSNTIPINPVNCIGWDCDTDVRFGRHESLASYKSCQYRERNKGLFNANQQLDGNSAIYTRQNPNGERRGLECPEERDYYPNWHPSEWRDLAILTNQPQRCAAYQAESQNVKERWSCVPPQGWLAARVAAGATGFIPITQEKCELITYVDPIDNITRTGQWVRTAPFNVAPPICHENVWTRDNHLGNVGGGFPVGFNLTVPGDVIHDQCAIRVRYNISTGDLGEQQDVANWLTPQSVQSSAFLNASLNENRQPTDRYPAKVDVWSKYGLTKAQQAASFDPNTNGNADSLKPSREYVFKDNPRVNIFGDLVPAIVKLRLAINTNQFGRTFQDRTHRIAIKARPSYIPQEARIHNLNVVGKRGNIVQTYPGHEYDFTPRRLHARRGDLIHWQWTGSNTNPNNNAGQGRQGSDRHNAVILRPTVYAEVGQAPTNPATLGHFGRSYPGKVDGAWTFLGMDVADLKSLARAQVSTATWSGELSELDDASTYFDLGPRAITANGIYHYICTRNNNFSNRDQRATIIVSDSTANTQVLGYNGGRVYGANGVYLEAETGDLSALNIITIETHGPGASNTMSDVASDYVDVQPVNFMITQNRALTLAVPYTRNGVGRTIMYRSATQHGQWNEIGAEFEGGVAYAQITQGGWYVVQTQTNWAGVIGVTLAVCVVIAGGAYGLYRYKKKKAASSGGAGVSTNYAGRRV